MFDLNRSYAVDLKERPLAAGVTVSEEGQCLIYVDDGAGGVACALSTGGVADYDGVDPMKSRVAGFAITDKLGVLTETAVEEFTIPAAAPFTVQLRNQNIVLAQTYVYNLTAAAAMAQLCPVPGAGQRCIDVTGLVTFNAAEAGNRVRVVYRYTLTAAQVVEKFHQRSVNNTAQDFFSTISLFCDTGEIFTSMFDAGVAYNPLDPIYSGAAGLVTSAAGGAYLGLVSKVPSVDDPLLGVKWENVA